MKLDRLTLYNDTYSSFIANMGTQSKEGIAELKKFLLGLTSDVQGEDKSTVKGPEDLLLMNQKLSKQVS
jgi:hypothetical protein